MYRDRTNLYISYRQSYAHHPQYLSTKTVPEEQQGLIDSADEVGIEMDVLPPAWLDVSDQVDELLTHIDTQLGQLQILHRKNALPGFDDRTSEEKEIEQLTYTITTEVHECQSLIKQFELMAAKGTSTEEERMARNMKVALATKVQATSGKFRKLQSSYLKAISGNRATSTGSSVGLIDLENGTGDAETEGLSTNALEEMAQTSVQIDSQSTAIQLREQEISKIATGILELSAIFKDLQTMVIDQGTLLDRIDYNIETMHTHVKAADKELIQATHYQKRTQKCKLILLLSLIVFGLFIILLIKPKRHSHSEVSKPAQPTAPEPIPEATASPSESDNESQQAPTRFELL